MLDAYMIARKVKYDLSLALAAQGFTLETDSTATDPFGPLAKLTWTSPLGTVEVNTTGLDTSIWLAPKGKGKGGRVSVRNCHVITASCRKVLDKVQTWA